MAFNDNTKNVAKTGRALRNVVIALGCVAAIAVGVLVVVHNPHPATAPGVDKKQLKETLATGAEYDFGFLEPEDTREVILAMANPAPEPIRVLSARTGCPCVTAAATKEAFQPGEPLEIRVEFTAPKKPIHYAKPLYVDTSDPKNKLLWVLIKADVGLPLVVEVPSSDLGTVIVGEGKETKISVTNRGKTPARLLYSVSSLPDCVLKAPSQAIPAGGKAEVPVIINAKSAGEKTATFNIATDVLGQENFPVAVKFTATASAPKP